MGTYGNTDGIMTLTNDPLVAFNIRRHNFQEGSRVICNDDGNTGTIVELDIQNDACVVNFDDGQHEWCEAEGLSPE